MIRSRNPRLDVAALERRIADELVSEPFATDERLARLAAQVHVRTIEAQLAHAEERAVPREAWPRDVRMFPFGSPSLQRMVLRLLRLAFRDQQEVNAALIRASRETLALSHVLLDRLAELETRVERERALERARRIARRHGDDEL